MTTKNGKKSKAWNVSLWVAQVLLAGMFLMVWRDENLYTY